MIPVDDWTPEVGEMVEVYVDESAHAPGTIKNRWYRGRVVAIGGAWCTSAAAVLVDVGIERMFSRRHVRPVSAVDRLAELGEA